MTTVCRYAPLVAVVLIVSLASPATAERFENGIAVFAALDKVTARISELEVPINETVEFGQLKVTPRVCYSRPPTERPKTTSFVEIDEVKLDATAERIFSGWMLAESPGLNAVEHPVFDVWLTGCKAPKTDVATAPSAGAQPGTAGEAAGAAAGIVEPQGADTTFQRRRIRR
ncbi:MAG: DUF2155 domain-containing protein [Alphaproteobacteria bacterium]|nr:DUF2155 domain-containing protein [Alphaproteobacteria bacterium]